MADSAYGMANCWNILDVICDFILRGLSEALGVASALSCIPSTEARVLNAGCFLRYSDASFANDSNGEHSKDLPKEERSVSSNRKCIKIM
ncbi:hypothetical protein NC652_018985 [Populus alba x Populus x berolinensis]|nr:hypothetical protein NC652_018985 [Populus alba x Populus x berolinensis]